MKTSCPETVAPPTTHPGVAALAAFGLGRLDEAESATIAEHVSGCDACRSLVEAVADDSLALLFRAADSPGDDADPDGPSRGAAGVPSGYELLEVVGEGGMGRVYRARQVGLGRLVALKQIRPEALAGRDGVVRFRREAEAAARLRHPNIVQVHDVGRRDGVPFYAMEFVEGGTLAGRLADGPLGARAAARLVETLALAVQHAHEAGIVHRDLKPSNVLLAPDLDCPKVADFGLAKSDDGGARTTTGAILGTPSYMAPEQAEGDSSRVGPSADIYALGAILYEALTGRPPFSSPSTLETLELVRRSEPIPPRRARRGVPRDLATIALKCLEKAPSRRYASARALAGDLRRHLDGEPIRARPISGAERLLKWSRRRPWRAAAVAIGVLAVAGLWAELVIHGARLRDEAGRTRSMADEARDQRARAVAQYRAARAAIRTMLGRFDEPAEAGRPIPMEFRRRLLDDALSFYEGAVRDDGTADFDARLDKARALKESAYLHLVLLHHPESTSTLRRALAALDSLEAERPGSAEVSDEQIDCRGRLGLSLWNGGRAEEALAWFAASIDWAEARGGPGPRAPAFADATAYYHHNLGFIDHIAGRRAEAEAHYRRAAEIRLGLLRDGPESTPLRGKLAETTINLALIHAQVGKLAQADEEYARAAGWLAPAVAERADDHTLATSLADLYVNWGSLAMFRHEPDRAIARSEAGMRPIEAVLRRFPDEPHARATAWKLHGVRAQGLTEAGRFAEAALAWGRSEGFADAGGRRASRLGRAWNLARSGDPAALAQAERAGLGDVGDRPPSGAELYNMACVAAIASASATASGDRHRAESCARRALLWLESARSSGAFRDPPSLAALDDDPDLAPLRGRRDFLLLRLDAAFPADPFSPRRVP